MWSFIWMTARFITKTPATRALPETTKAISTNSCCKLPVACALLEYRAVKYRLAARQDFVHGVLQQASHFLADRSHDPGITGCLRRVAVLDVYGSQELCVPFGWKRQRQQW